MRRTYKMAKKTDTGKIGGYPAARGAFLLPMMEPIEAARI